MSPAKVLLTLVAALTLCVTVAAGSANAGTIYDSNVENRLSLQGAQRARVLQIVRESDRQMQRIFRKYGINPYAKPDLDKLQMAARELHSIETNEINKMSKVLNDKQFRQYKKILAETAARVKAAAQ